MQASSGFSVSRPALKSLALAVTLALGAGAAMAQEKVLRIAMTAGDIPRTSGQPDQGFEGNRFTGIPMYDALTQWDLSKADKPSELVPGLALSWEVDAKDKTKWLFKLRPGVKFHDGSAFTADAVVWNVNKVLDKEAEQFDPAQVGVTASRMPTLKSAKKIDDLTVELTTSEPDSFLPINLSNLFMASPAHWAKKLAAVPASVSGKAERSKAAWTAFAADPSRGLFILVFLGIVIGGSLLLYVLRSPRLGGGAPFTGASRETLLLFNNVLLTSAAGMVLLGTLYPLLADALDLGKISVGPPYFGLLFVLLMAPLVLLLPFGPLTKWQRDEPSRVLRLLGPWAVLAAVLGVIAYFMAPQGQLKTAAGIAAAAWVALGTLRFVWTRFQVKGKRFTPEMLGMVLAHGGVAVFLVGALLVEALNVQHEVAMKPGQTIQVGRYAFRFEGVDSLRGPNYTAERGHIQVFRDDKPLVLLHPEKRAYASGGMVMTEAAIRPSLLGDVFVAVGEDLGNDAHAVRVHLKPFIRWVWLGAALMALGGFVTATDRRFRRKTEEPR